MVLNHCTFYFRNLRKFVWPCNVHRAELGTFPASVEQSYSLVLPDPMYLNLYIAFSNLVGPIISIRFHAFGPTCVLPECTAALKRFHLGSRPFAKVL